MKLPWHRLSQIAGQGGTLKELKAYYGDDWHTISPYFLPTKKLATTIECPKPGGDGCPRKVIEHSFHDIVAVCGNSPKECEPVKLSRRDLIIYELKIEKLLVDLSRFLNIQGRLPIKWMRLTWELGPYKVKGQPHIPVYTSLLVEPDKLQSAAFSLLIQKEEPFFLLLSSRKYCPVQLANTLQKAGVHLVGLDELHDKQITIASADLLRMYIPALLNEDAENIFRLEKDNWRIIFHGRPYTIRQSVGMQYITILIDRAYNGEGEIHVAELYYLVKGRHAVEENELWKLNREQLIELGLDVATDNDGIDLTTPEGKKRIKEALDELTIEIEEAESFGHAEEADRLEKAKSRIQDYIKASYGLSGRSRQTSNTNEKIRKTVEGAIRYCLKTIGLKADDPLAVYLNSNIKRGNFCYFRKDQNINWKIIF